MNPSVEATMPCCSCGFEIGKLQYQLRAKASFEEFLARYHITNSDTSILFADYGETVRRLKMCCRKDVVFPQFVVLPKEQVSSSQRLLPTALPAPLLAGDILEWY